MAWASPPVLGPDKATSSHGLCVLRPRHVPEGGSRAVCLSPCTHTGDPDLDPGLAVGICKLNWQIDACSL